MRFSYLTMVCMAVGGIALNATAHQNIVHPDNVKTEPIAVFRRERSPVEGYKQWLRVNAVPHEVSSFLALLCRGTTQAELTDEASNPHIDTSEKHTLMREKFVTVYVNAPAAGPMLHQKVPRFPEGSIIVKAKLTSPSSSVPELLTVMRKMKPGYHPAAGDWEYLVADGTGTQIQLEGRITNCEACHAKWKKADFVSRAYLSSAALARLR